MPPLEEGEWSGDLALDGLGEHSDDALNAVSQHVEAGLNGLSFGRPSLIERYAVGDIAIHLDFALSADGNRPADKLSAVLHWPTTRDLAVLDRDAAVLLKRQLAVAKKRAGEVECAVLVGIAELVENPEQVDFGFAPAVVKRMDALDDSFGGIAQAANLPESAGTIRIPKQRLVFENGEFRSAGWLPIEAAEGIDGVVESGSQPVDCLADDDAPLQGWRSDHMNVADLVAGLVVYIKREAVGAILKPPLDRRVQSFRMLVRSFDLQPRAFQRVFRAV
jgi:hypothetical protein